MGDSKEYNNLYELYKNKSREELEEIANDMENSYREEARKVAKDILESEAYNEGDRKRQETFEHREKQYQVKREAQGMNPLYDDIHQIAQDVRFFKTLVIILIVIDVIGALIPFFK